MSSSDCNRETRKELELLKTKFKIYNSLGLFAAGFGNGMLLSSPHTTKEPEKVVIGVVGGMVSVGVGSLIGLSEAVTMNITAFAVSMSKNLGFDSKQ